MLWNYVSDQEERSKAIEAYKSGKKDVLVATDVASKGLDFPHIQHVINYDMPDDIENYGECLSIISAIATVHACFLEVYFRMFLLCNILILFALYQFIELGVLVDLEGQV